MKQLLVSLPLFLAAVLPLNHFTVQKSVRALQDENGRNICTVTSINQERKLWLTAAHCVADVQAGVRDVYVETHPADVVFVDVKIDLAVLEVDELDVPAVKIAKTMPEVGARIFVVGHPLGLDQVQLFQGYVSSLRTEVDGDWYMLYDMTACGGNSGSLVINGKDEVVSVLQIGFGQGCSAFTGGATWQELGKVRKYFG